MFEGKIYQGKIYQSHITQRSAFNPQFDMQKEMKVNMQQRPMPSACFLGLTFF